MCWTTWTWVESSRSGFGHSRMARDSDVPKFSGTRNTQEQHRRWGETLPFEPRLGGSDICSGLGAGQTVLDEHGIGIARGHHFGDKPANRLDPPTANRNHHLFQNLSQNGITAAPDTAISNNWNKERDDKRTIWPVPPTGNRIRRVHSETAATRSTTSKGR